MNTLRHNLVDGHLKVKTINAYRYKKLIVEKNNTFCAKADASLRQR